MRERGEEMERGRRAASSMKPCELVITQSSCVGSRLRGMREREEEEE